MTREELSNFLGDHQEVEWKDDENGITLRHGTYDKPDEGIRIEWSDLTKITPQTLDKSLVNGRSLAHYTRITGYFSAVENWNPGKLGELKDRYKQDISLQIPQSNI